jgi:hypothetical protein
VVLTGAGISTGECDDMQCVVDIGVMQLFVRRL